MQARTEAHLEGHASGLFLQNSLDPGSDAIRAADMKAGPQGHVDRLVPIQHAPDVGLAILHLKPKLQPEAVGRKAAFGKGAHEELGRAEDLHSRDIPGIGP